MTKKDEKIGIIIGTNRKNSLTEIVAKYYIKLLNKKNITPIVIDLKELPKDFTATALYENNGKNNEFNIIKAKLSKCDKIFIIIPEYNGSMPGVFKSFIDGLEFPKDLQNKKCALTGVSAGKGGCLLGISHLTDILNHLGSYVLPNKIFINSIYKPDINLILQKKDTLKAIEKQITSFLIF